MKIFHKNFLKKLLINLGITVLVFVLVAGYKHLEETKLEIRFLDPIEKLTLAIRFFYKDEYPQNYISDETLVVGIDSKSLSEIGKWPWYREIHAEFVDKVQQFSPLSLHLDIMFNMDERLPSRVKNKLTNQTTLEVVDQAFKDLDILFSKTLSNYNNVYIDQLLLSEHLLNFSEQLDRKFKFNEEVLKTFAVKIPNLETKSIPYTYVEPVVEKFIQNAIPSVVNAIPDQDNVLRSAVLIFPYEGSDHQKHYFSSIYLLLLLRYYDITLSDVNVVDGFVELDQAKAPILDEETRNPIVQTIDRDTLERKLFLPDWRGQDYNENFYRFIVNFFRIRFSQDQVKTPNFPISVLVGEEDEWTLFRGREIYDAAKELDSKELKVIFYKRKKISIPTLVNSRDNPFSFLVNYATQEKKVQLSNGRLKEKLMLPTVSYNDVYQQPYYPKMPLVDQSGKIIEYAEYRQEFEQWFRNFVKSRFTSVQEKVYHLYREVTLDTLLTYALEDNPYEGSFIFYNLYLNQLEGPLDKEIYLKFIESFFLENNLPLNHSLISDFALEENVALEYLIDAYQENYQKFYNKLLFVGPTTLGMARDVHKTPYGDMFGINTIVNAFNTVIKENFLISSSRQTNLIVLAILCLFSTTLFMSFGNYFKYGYFVFSSFTILVVSIILFIQNNYILYTSNLLIANFIIFVIATLYSLLGEERNKRFLHSTFATYLSPEVIDDMYEKKEMPTLGGEEKYISAYFTDIQGFSSFSEILTAQQLVELLNEYLGAMTDILLEQKGTLDKYEGDAIIAFFGAPLHLPDAAYRACLTSVKMQQKLLQLRTLWSGQKGDEYKGRNLKKIPAKLWKSKDKWPKLVHHMRMRIGINSGNIVVGNMGSIRRQNYTMMGDDVNLAARLESAAKQYGIFTIVSGQTLGSKCQDEEGREFQVKDKFCYRLVDKIQVVGKSEAVEIYEILDLKQEATSKINELVAVFNEAIQLYFKRRWLKAKTKFEQAEKLEPYLSISPINPSRVFIERCVKYRKNLPPRKPGKQWDGVTVLTSK